MEKLEERRVELIERINHIIDEQKKKRDDLARNEKTMDSKCHDLQKKLDYVEKLTTCLESSNAEYSDYDVIETDQKMLTALEEIEQCNVNRPASVVRYVPGDINEGLLRGMIGTIEDSTTNIDAIMKVEDIETFKVCDETIRNIAPISDTQAWVDNSSDKHIALMSIEKGEIKHMKFSSYFRDFISLSNDQFIAISAKTQTIRRVLSNGKESVIAKTKPLRPTFVSKTHTDDILVTVRDCEDDYKLKSSSRRLVQRMTLKGIVTHAYEFREDNETLLFTLPERAVENTNSDICVINRTGHATGELIVLHRDGRMRFAYRGQNDDEYVPTDVACDDKSRIVISYPQKLFLYLLSPYGMFLGHMYLLHDIPDCLCRIALHQGRLWVGFKDGTLKVYRYLQ